MKRVLIFATTYFPLVGGAEIALKEITDRLPNWQFDLVCARIRFGLPNTERIGNVTVHRVGFGHSIDKYLLAVLGPLLAMKAHPLSSSEAHPSNLPFVRGGSSSMGSKGSKKSPPYEGGAEGVWSGELIWSLLASYGGFAALVYTWIRPRTKMLLTLQEGDPLEHYAKRAGVLTFLHKMIFKRADAVQAISTFLAQWAKDMGFRGTPTVIPNGVDIAKFTARISSEKRAELRRQFGYADGDVVIVTASRLSLKNAVDDLIRSLRFLPANFKVLVAGIGEDEEKLKALVIEERVEGRVRFLGKKTHEELPGILQSADIFCRPSLSEGLGNSFLEAMAAGLPIIGTPVGGIPDFLTHGETGVFCQTRDPESIARAAMRIQSEAGLREKLIRQGEALVRERYGWEGIAASIERMLTQLADRKRILIATGIYPPEIGGPATFVPHMAAYLSGLRDVVHVLTYGDEHTQKSPSWPVTVVSRRYGPMIRYVRYALNAWRLARKCDMMFAQGAVSEGFPSMIAAIFAHKPFVVRIPGDYAWEMSMQRSSSTELLDEFLGRRHAGMIGLFERIERWVVLRADRVIVPSRYLQSVVERWGVDAKKISVIYNSGTERPSSSDASPIRRDGKRILLTSIRALPWKGGDFLISLLPNLPTDHLLVIAGDGPLLEEWKRMAKKMGVTDRVEFLGRIPSREMDAWYRAADLFLLATGYEGYPHTVAEAVATGLPCIVSDKGGNPETAIQFPSLVRVAPYRDREAWLTAIGQLVSRGESQKVITPQEVGASVRSILSSVCAS